MKRKHGVTPMLLDSLYPPLFEIPWWLPIALALGFATGFATLARRITGHTPVAVAIWIQCAGVLLYEFAHYSFGWVFGGMCVGWAILGAGLVWPVGETKETILLQESE